MKGGDERNERRQKAERPTDPQPGDRQEQNGQMPGWVQLGEDVPELRDAPFKLHFRTFSSSSPEANAFIRDPRRSMRGEQVEGYEEAETAVLEGIDADTRISTFVVNHHRTLARRIIYAMATVAHDDNVAAVTLYKLEA